MHSLVLSQCSEIPHKLSSDIQELLRSWATICTGASSCANKGPFGYIFAGQFFPVHSPKRPDIKRPHCTSCQDQIDRVLNWQGPRQKKHEKGPSIEPCGTPSASTGQFPLPPHQSHQGKIFQEASVHLRKCLSLAGLDMTIKRRRGRNFGLSCLTLFLLSLDAPTTPLNTCARSQFFRDEYKILMLLSPFQEIQHFKRGKENNWKLGQAHKHPC